MMTLKKVKKEQSKEINHINDMHHYPEQYKDLVDEMSTLRHEQRERQQSILDLKRQKRQNTEKILKYEDELKELKAQQASLIAKQQARKESEKLDSTAAYLFDSENERFKEDKREQLRQLK